MMATQRNVKIDDETWHALTSWAELRSENISACVRDMLRSELSRHGYEFTSDVRRYARRGTGRRSK